MPDPTLDGGYLWEKFGDTNHSLPLGMKLAPAENNNDSFILNYEK